MGLKSTFKKVKESLSLIGTSFLFAFLAIVLHLPIDFCLLRDTELWIYYRAWLHFFLDALWPRKDKTWKMCGQTFAGKHFKLKLFPLHYGLPCLLLPLALARSSTVINDVVTTCWHFTPFIFFQRHPDRRSDPSREAADLDAQEDLRRRRPELHRELARPPDQPDDLGRKRNLLFARRFKVSEQKLLGCGSVGRVVAADTRDLQFESRHRQSFIYLLCNRIDENKGKDGQEWPIFKKATS